MRYPPLAVLGQPYLGVTLVAPQRIAAGGDEIDDAVERLPVDARVGRSADDLRVKLVRVERRATGAAQNVLRQHVERAGEQRRRVLGAEIIGFEGCPALQHLEAVGGYQQRLRRLVHAVVGPADALRQPAGALRRTDMHDKIDVAPVDAEIQRRGGDDGAQAARLHRPLHLAALADIERAVMQRDRQRIVVHPPQFLEQHLGLAARVDEKQRGPVVAHRIVDFGNGITRHVACPRHAHPGIEDRNVRLGAAGNRDQFRKAAGRVLRHQPAPQLVRLGDGRRQADGLQAGDEAAQPRQPERQEMAAFRSHQRMQFIKHDVTQVAEEPLGIRGRDQQGKLFGRGQQDVRRRQLLALSLVDGRVAGARLHGNRQTHLADRLAEVALDVDGERFQRRDIERVDATMRLARLALRPHRQIGQRGQEAGQRLAGAGRGDQQNRFSGLGAGEQLDLVSARRPAAFREPVKERLREKGGGVLGREAGLLRHASEVAPGAKNAKRNLEQNGIM